MLLQWRAVGVGYLLREITEKNKATGNKLLHRCDPARDPSHAHYEFFE